VDCYCGCRRENENLVVVRIESVEKNQRGPLVIKGKFSKF